MSFSLDEIRKLAKLARLALAEDEMARLQHDLNDIVQYVERLNAINVDGVVPMTHAVPVQFTAREDEVRETIGRAGLLGSAGYEDGLVKVPKIIE